MTLGGLALSVGILVDQAIVTIENIERHLHDGHAAARGDPRRRGRDRRAGVRLDAVHLHRVRADVLPLRRRALPVRADGEAVVFAMIASYILSRTLVPTLVMLLMGGAHAAAPTRHGRARCSASTAPSTRSSSACARAYTLTLVGAAREARAASRSASSPSAVLLVPALPGARPRLLPERRRRPDPPALPRADRHAHRGDRAHRRRRRGGDPRADPEGPARDDPRQPRRAQQRHQPRRTATPAPSARSTARS